MFNIFFDKGSPRLPALNNPLAETVQRQFNYIELTLKDYYARSSYRLPNNHILIQVLRTLSFSLTKEYEEVVSSIVARAPYVAKHFGFTSPISSGKPHKKAFYAGEGSVDYIYDFRQVDLDPFMKTSQFRDMAPVLPLYHSAIDFNFILPTGDKQPYKNNFSVVMVDTALLALQYHLWKIEQQNKLGDEAILNPNVFLVREVLPKMYRKHFNLTLINNMFLDGGFHKRADVKDIPLTPVTLPDITPRARVITKELHRATKKRRNAYIRTLQSLPLPGKRSALQELRIPRGPKTIQGTWILWLSRFRYMFELIRLGGQEAVSVNRTHIAQLKGDLRMFLADKGYEKFQNPELEDEFLYFAGYVENL